MIQFWLWCSVGGLQIIHVRKRKSPSSSTHTKQKWSVGRLLGSVVSISVVYVSDLLHSASANPRGLPWPNKWNQWHKCDLYWYMLGLLCLECTTHYSTMMKDSPMIKLYTASFAHHNRIRPPWPPRPKVSLGGFASGPVHGSCSKQASCLFEHYLIYCDDRLCSNLKVNNRKWWIVLFGSCTCADGW